MIHPTTSVHVEDQASSLKHGSIWVVGCSETGEHVPWKNAQFYMILVVELRPLTVILLHENKRDSRGKRNRRDFGLTRINMTRQI